MSVPITATIDEVHAKRWREWQLKNADDDRQRARRARLVFIALFVVLAAWLVIQLL